MKIEKKFKNITHGWMGKVNSKNIAKKVYRLISKPKKNIKHPVQFSGSNWLENEELPVALFFGFNTWKQDIFSRFFPEYKCAFISKNIKWSIIVKDFLNRLEGKGVSKLVIFNWGAQELPKDLQRWLTKQKSFDIEFRSVEDGFLRSIGTGLLHTRPMSICSDASSIYFNAHQESDLEKILNEYDFENNKELLKRAENAIELIKAGRLTKYYDITPNSKVNTFKRTTKYSILIVGQVEDDASIQYGKSSIKLNTKLVLAASKEHPGADIYFKPHPDYLSKNREEKSNIKALKNKCVILPENTKLSEVIDKVDHIYTITSLVGLEALIKGKKVTTFGAPFYSNWGLTEDRVIINRRNKKRSLVELIAATYFIYPKYFHPNCDLETNFEDIVSFSLVEVLKYENILQFNKDSIYNEIKPFISNLSTPLKVIEYLASTKQATEANSKELFTIIDQNLELKDYPQISFLLIKTSNFDQLIEYTNRCLSVLKSNLSAINSELLHAFFYSLSITLRNTNGRVINDIPCLSDYFLSRIFQDKKLISSLTLYISCCSMNLHYQQIEKLLALFYREQDIAPFQLHESMQDYIERQLSFKPTIGFYDKILNIIHSKSSRSERNYQARFRIAKSVFSLYEKSLYQAYPDDSALNDIFLLLKNKNIDEAELILSKIIEADNTQNIEKILSLKTRFAHWLFVANTFIKYRRLETIEPIVIQLIKIEDSEKTALLDLLYTKAKRDYINLDLKLAQYSAVFIDNNKIQTLKARYLREQGKFEQSLVLYQEQHNMPGTIARKDSLQQEIDKIQFSIKASDIINSVPQPSIPKGIVFIASQTCFNSLAMITPSLVELKRKGYSIVNLTQGIINIDSTGLSCVDKLSGAIPLDLTKAKTVNDLHNNWIINWDKKEVISDGINYYQGFYERLSTFIRKYHVDLKEPYIYDLFIDQLLRADICLSVCNEIYNDPVKRHQLNVTFMTSNSHVTPYSIFRDYALAKKSPHMGFINCNVAYEAYFSNLGSKFSNTMCVSDMTLYPTIRAPFMARREQFEPWYAKNKFNAQYQEQANNLIKVNRVGSENNQKELSLIEKIIEKKKQGIKIICAFGKVPVDLNVPFDGGPAHQDMADWINHTVEVCNGNNDILLLVKPHPHELKPQIALDLVDGFNDLITHDVEDNIWLLGHKDINGHALAPYLDLALLYNGSTSLELTAQGIPVVMTSYFGRYDYPVDLHYPESREEYAQYILSKDYKAPDQVVREKAAYLMCYMGTDEISILNQYTKRQLTNDRIGIPTWNTKKIEKLLSEGDPSMRLIADRVTEKFENKLC
jgi:capsular polysaccharide export protein